MKYYVNGIEVSELEAQEIDKKNKEYLASGDLNLWFKIQYIVVVK
jgi:hypothetical protein